MDGWQVAVPLAVILAALQSIHPSPSKPRVPHCRSAVCIGDNDKGKGKGNNKGRGGVCTGGSALASRPGATAAAAATTSGSATPRPAAAAAASAAATVATELSSQPGSAAYASSSYPSEHPSGSEGGVARAAAVASQSVVGILVSSPLTPAPPHSTQSPTPSPSSLSSVWGSGVLISPSGLILTNAHLFRHSPSPSHTLTRASRSRQLAEVREGTGGEGRGGEVRGNAHGALYCTLPASVFSCNWCLFCFQDVAVRSFSPAV